MRVLLALTLCFCARAQFFPFPGPGNPAAGGGGSGITLLDHCSASGSGSGATVTCSFAGGTCGAGNFIMVGVATSSTTFTVTASPSLGAFTNITENTDSADVADFRWSYVFNVSPTNTTSISTTANFPSLAAACLSNAKTTSPAAGSAGANNLAWTTIAPHTLGSITPSVGGDVMFSGISHFESTVGAISVDSGYTITDHIAFASSVHYGIDVAYKIKSSGDTTAENPVWSVASGTMNGSGTNAAFLHN